MPAYLIVRMNVTDPEQYQQYMKLTPDIIAQYGGRFIVRGGEKVTLEGPEETRRMVVVEFDSMEQGRRFYESPEYQHAIGVRAEAAEGQFVLVEGTTAG
jgi:uncharacterized protein (DUF1330 family)